MKETTAPQAEAYEAPEERRERAPREHVAPTHAPAAGGGPEPLRPPGPGCWTLDVTHVDRPLSRFLRALFVPAFVSAQAHVAERYGLPLETVDLRSVADGFMYLQPVPLGGPRGAKPPPAFVLRLLFTMVPALRRRRRAAERTFREKIWRADLERWREETLPGLLSRGTALYEEPLESFGDGALAEHVERLATFVSDAIWAHIATNGMTMIPTGDFLVHVQRWTGRQAADALLAVRGAEDEQDPARALRAVLADHPQLLEGAPDAVLARLRARDDAVGEAARAWLAYVEPRQITVSDLHQPTGAERPDLLVAGLRAPRPERPCPDEVAAALREEVPEAHRATFDALLAEARATHLVRDQRSVILDTLTYGVCRHSLLACGRRLRDRGLLERDEDAIHLSPEELVRALRAGEVPRPEEVRRRRAGHRRSIDEMPRFLGGDALELPPHERFPGALGRLLAALAAYVAHMEGERPPGAGPNAPAPSASTSASTVEGIPASGGVHEGRACVVLDPEDLGRVGSGDVLVVRSTRPSYTGVMALSGAVVTDRGGALSHAAIVSRELGIPAVVGTKVATQRIRDGARVRVDGSAGRVELLS